MNIFKKISVLHKGELFHRIKFFFDTKTKRYERYIVSGTKKVEIAKKLDIFSNETELKFNNLDINTNCHDETCNCSPWYELNESMFNGDIREYWESSRFQDINIILSNYIVTQDDAYLVKIDDFLINWFKKNPIDCGFNHISNLEIAIRFVSLYRIYYYASDQISFDINRVLYIYGLHLFFDLPRTNACIPNNHSLGEATALLLAANIFQNKKWEKLAVSTIKKRIDLINDNGESIEESSGYQLFVTQMLLLISAITREFDSVIIPRIVKSRMILSALSDNEGNIAPFGDCDDGVFYVFDELTSNNITNITNHFLINSKKVDEYEHHHDISIRKTSEYISIIENGVWKVALIGGYDLNHAHVQSLSFVAWHKGKQVVFAPGTFRYNGDRSLIRKKLASQEFSNTPKIIGIDRNNYVTNFRHHRIIKDVSLVASNEQESICGMMKIRGKDIKRTITIKDDFLEVIDEGNAKFDSIAICGCEHLSVMINGNNCVYEYKPFSPKYGTLSEKPYFILLDSNHKKNVIVLKYEESIVFNKA